MRIKDAKGEPGVREAERRARILDRYDAIERPDANDDAAAAEEMDLSVDTFLRLASVRRLHASEARLVGRTAALKRGGGAPRDLVMATAVDLNLVRPGWRADILRKIRIIQRHIAATELGEGDVGAAAEEMGVSVAHFQVLANTWMLEARAEALPGAMRRGTPWRRQPDRARRRELLKAALDHADPGRSLRTAYDAFVAACRGEDLKPLSLPRFYALAQELRADRT